MNQQEQISNLQSESLADRWYLGIDFGTKGLSAAILNRNNAKVYPIYWQQLDEEATLEDGENIGNNGNDSVKEEERITFKLPSKVYISGEENWEEKENISPGDRLLSGESQNGKIDEKSLLLHDFKHCLKICIPYVKVEVTRQKPDEQQTESFLLASNFSVLTSPEPILQRTLDSEVSLAGIRQGLVTLLATLTRLEPAAFIVKNKHEDVNIKEGKYEGSAVREVSEIGDKSEKVSLKESYICRAEGLGTTELKSAIKKLEGVILGCPASWSEAYRFNLREAVLEAGLANNLERIFVVEDAIATLFSELKLGKANNNFTFINNSNNFRKGGTLIINAGATTTELAVVSLPEDILKLNYSDFSCHTYNYGGNAFDQDFVCKLLLEEENFIVGTKSQSLPRPGFPDLSIRYQLQQWLESSALRMALLQAANNLKIILQEEERFTFKIGPRSWQVKQRDLESKVLVPFVQQLNRELNTLLTKVGMSPVGINQAICTGGSSSFPALHRWLRQKLPNAIILRDAPGETTEMVLERLYNLPADAENINSKTSRVAYGLAALGLYPQMLENPRQQYGDYFLLGELLKVVPAQPLKKEEIIQLLESRGINTRVCQGRIEKAIEGPLPAGLIPSEEDLVLLGPVSRQNSDYQALRGRPLFSKRRNGTYVLNLELAEDLGQYLSRVVATSGQKLEEPLVPSK